jgi:hypothetical protein
MNQYSWLLPVSALATIAACLAFSAAGVLLGDWRAVGSSGLGLATLYRLTRTLLAA